MRLLTRKGLDWTGKFPNIADAVASFRARTAVIDGEIVVEDDSGISSFSGLQAALKASERERFVYYVFDLLHVDGRDLALVAADRAQGRAGEAWSKGRRDRSRYSEHFEDDGALVLRHACAMALEGIVSKRGDAPYRSGRSDTFIKTKCSNAQEFVVGGYSPSTVLRERIGALVVGYYDGGQLIYAGRIGTGYTRAVARDLWKRLASARDRAAAVRSDSRADDRAAAIRAGSSRRLVIEAHLRGWTADALVRQAAFKGVREDKPPRRSSGGAGREQWKIAKLESRRAKDRGRDRKAMTKTLRAGAMARAGKMPSGGRPKERTAMCASPIPIGSIGWTPGSPSRTWRTIIVRSGTGWRRISSAGRWRCCAVPTAPRANASSRSMHRPACASSICAPSSTGTGVRSSPSKISPGCCRWCRRACSNCMCAARCSTGSICATVSCSTSIPAPASPGREVVAAAREVRERLAAVDLESFVKLSGGKGLHVVLPIDGADWETIKAFAQAVAFAMVADVPERYVAKMTKSLRTGKIFVDYLRNSLEQTSVAAYSTRARAGAPVSVPVTWEELGRTKSGQPVYRAQSGQAPRGPEAGSLEGHRAAQAEAAAVTAELSCPRKRASSNPEEISWIAPEFDYHTVVTGSPAFAGDDKDSCRSQRF